MTQTRLPPALLPSVDIGGAFERRFPSSTFAAHERIVSLHMANTKAASENDSQPKAKAKPSQEESSNTSTAEAINGNDDQDDSILMTPHPPSYPPPLGYSGNLTVDYDVLQEEYTNKESNITSLQDEITNLQQQLESKEQALQKGRDAWSVEKSSLIGKIAEFTRLLGNKRNVEEDEEEETERMEREVSLLQGQLTGVQNQLRQEQKATVKVRQRLEEVEDAMEFQQMEFKKEKDGLQNSVEENKMKLASIESQWARDKKRFTAEQAQIGEELQQETDRLKAAQAVWERNQADFQKEQESLQQQLAAQKTTLQQTQIELSSERVELDKDRAEFKEAIQQEQSKVRKIEQTLADEQTRFQQDQAELEKQIRDEQEKVVMLGDRLEREQKRFENETNMLEARLDLEHQRLTAVEQQLAEERVEFKGERDQLEEQVTEEVRVRKLKKRQMNERYEAIRQELTALWQGAKREARQERTALMNKYDVKVGALNGTIAELESSLFCSRKSGDELQILLKDVTEQKERAVQDAAAIERRYIITLAVRNQEIMAMQSDLRDLRSTVKEKEEKLERYETSLREVLKLSVQVTGRKLQRSRSRVSGWIKGKRDVGDTKNE
jgi:chromosome segregation ATPase